MTKEFKLINKKKKREYSKSDPQIMIFCFFFCFGKPKKENITINKYFFLLKGLGVINYIYFRAFFSAVGIYNKVRCGWFSAFFLIQLYNLIAFRTLLFLVRIKRKSFFFSNYIFSSFVFDVYKKK